MFFSRINRAKSTISKIIQGGNKFVGNTKDQSKYIERKITTMQVADNHIQWRKQMLV